MSPRPEVAEDAAAGGQWSEVYGDEPKPTPAELAAQHRGQARFAYLLADSHADRLMHVHGIGWFTWDGTRWAVDEGDKAATRAVTEVLRRQWSLAYGDAELARDVKSCQSAPAVSGVLDLASAIPELSASVADLDADPYLLNCANGTLDLRTMQLEPHNPRDRITKVTRAAYRPGTRSNEWDAFLARVLPDEAVRGYLARFVGAALVGLVVEQDFTLASGVGANGKGTAYEAILNAVGDYGHVMDSDLLTASRSGSGHEAKPGLVELRGRRLVVTSETEREVTLAAALMKRLTGGDTLVARALYRDPIKFQPSHSILMVTNHLPKLPGNDPAVWRRVRVVPFDVVIPEGERDKTLPERLKLHADAVLAWALAGWAAYQRQGMAAPEAVKVATKEYRRRSDGVARFLDVRCIVSPAAYAVFGELWEAWQSWARDDGADEISKREFGDELDNRGYRSTQRKIYSKTTTVRVGIGLIQTSEEGEDDA